MRLKQLLAALALLLPLAGLAQARIAVYNSNDIFNSMPEKQRAEKRLQQSSQRLEAEYTRMQADLDSLFADYQQLAADPDTPATIRDRRLRQVQDGDMRLKQFRDNAAAEIAEQRRLLTEPIVSAIDAAVKEIGDLGNYDLILDLAKTPVAFANPATVTDITKDIKSRLGL